MGTCKECVWFESKTNTQDVGNCLKGTQLGSVSRMALQNLRTSFAAKKLDVGADFGCVQFETLEDFIRDNPEQVERLLTEEPT